jgi:RNA polymerase sigma-70 factor (ECF subfamily)
VSRNDRTFLDELIVLRAQAGERAALDTVLERLAQPLHRAILPIVGDSARAEDALQETLWRVARKIQWLSDPSLLLPWAYRIATREAYAVVKKDRRWRQADEEDLRSFEGEPGPAPLELDERIAELPRLVAELSPASRAVVTLHYGGQLILPEVAAILDVPLGTVKSRLAYGLEVLRRHFEGART